MYYSQGSSDCSACVTCLHFIHAALGISQLADSALRLALGRYQFHFFLLPRCQRCIQLCL